MRKKLRCGLPRFTTLFSMGTLLFHGAIAASAVEDVWTREERLAFFSQYLPMTKEGKIDIPSHITSVKFDIGLSENAPMTQVWLAEQENLLVFGIEPNPKAIALVLARGVCFG